MVTIDANEARPGTKLLIDGQLYNVVEREHHKPGKGNTIVRFKLKGLTNGKVIDYNVRSSATLEQADVMMKNMQFSYLENDQYIFMDMDSFEQMPVPAEVVGFAANFLKENMDAQITMYQGQAIGLSLPPKVDLVVVDTYEGARSSANNTNVSKEAELETGFKAQVPQFIKKGDAIRLRTEDGAYLERA